MLTEIKHRHLEFHDTNRVMAAMEVNYPDGTSTDLHSHPRQGSFFMRWQA